jgi:thymidylate kinase
MLQDSPPRLYIIEGIPGSGKDTLVRTLQHALHSETRPVYYYPEEAVAFSYGQVFWPNITNVRLSIMETALDFVEKEFLRTPGSLFVFNRFHLSTAVAIQSSIDKDQEVTARYQKIIERLHSVPVLVLLLTLEERRVTRLTHQERLGHDFVWQDFLARVTHETPHQTLEEFYSNQQEQFLGLAKEQALPYRTGSLPELIRFEREELH